MRISSEDLTVFRKQYLAQYGQKLSESEAQEKATRAFRLMELIYKRMSKTDHDDVTNRLQKIRASESYRSRQLVA